MKNTESHRPADARGVELLENRQLFAGFTPQGPGFFPGLMPAAHYVEIDRGVGLDIALANIRFLIGNIPQGNAASAPTGTVTDDGSSSAGTSASDAIRTSPGNASAAAFSHATVAAADGTADVASRSPASVAAIALDATPSQPTGVVSITPGAVKRSSEPTPPVVLNADLPKVFADRPATAVAIMQAAASSPLASVLPSYLKAPAAYEMSAYQAPAAHNRISTATADADQSVTVQGVKLAQAPQRLTLAAVPTGNLLSQPLWQRIAAASATVVLLAVNWMLRRKREQVRHADRVA